MKKIRWGIVGPGNIARKFAKAVKNVECAELAAVASRSLEKSLAFAKEYGIPHSFGSYEDMASFDGIDAVYVATPHPFHKPCAEIFINAKKHVLCEKPICVNANQAQILKDSAKKNGVFLMEAMWTKFLPAINKVKSMLQSGIIGDVMGITADFCYNAVDDVAERKIFKNDLAGGGLLDVGVYGLHFVSYILDMTPESINPVAYVKDGVDYHTCVSLKYPNGVIANISSAIAVEKPADAHIYGTNGRIRIPLFYGAKEFYVISNGAEQKYSFPSIGDGFEEEIIESCNCINNGNTESNTHPLDSSIEIIKQMDYIRSVIGVKYPLEGEE